MGRRKKDKLQKDQAACAHFTAMRAARSARRQSDAATRIQANARMRAAQNKVDSIRQAARLANKLVRGFLARRRVRTLRQLQVLLGRVGSTMTKTKQELGSEASKMASTNEGEGSQSLWQEFTRLCCCARRQEEGRRQAQASGCDIYMVAAAAAAHVLRPSCRLLESGLSHASAS
ncbi:unnamed protein product [Symbiodinium sp. CCMP2592]|nr:unnamed protein product [Symbiodinium sp. CCMP2592]